MEYHYKRSKKAITTLREFLIKHMKPGTDEKGRILLKIGKYLNDHIWKHGIKNPPHHVKITAKKDEKGSVFAELEGAPVEKEEKPKKEKGLAGKVEEKKEAPKEEAKKEEKAKEEEKKELKAIKKEKPKAPEKAPAAPKKIEKKVTGPANKQFYYNSIRQRIK